MSLADEVREQARRQPLEVYGAILGAPQSVRAGDAGFCCPWCDDGRQGAGRHTHLNVVLNGEKGGLWACPKCGRGGDVFDLQALLRGMDVRRDFVEVAQHLAERLRIPTDLPAGTEPAGAPRNEAAPLPDALVDQFHARLLRDPDRLAYLTQTKGLLLPALELGKIGWGKSPMWAQERYTIPIPGPHGWADIRGYLPAGEPKMLPWAKGRPGATLYVPPGALDSGATVWAEGELDCLNLASRDIPAITNTCGAGAAVRVDIPDLDGKCFVVCGDHDEAGRKMNADLPPRLLAAGAREVRVLEWPAGSPSGYDVCDYFAAGGTTAAFRELTRSARNVTPPPAPRTEWPADQLLRLHFREPEWVLPDLIPIGLTLLGGKPKTGKSWFCLQLSLAKASGDVMLHRPLQAGPVLYLALEDSPRRVQGRMRMQRWPDCPNVVFCMERWTIEQLRQQIPARQVKLVIIDTLSRFLGDADQMDIADMTRELGQLQMLALELEVGIVIVDHHRKAGEGDMIGDILGSTSKGAVADTILGLYRQPGQPHFNLRAIGRDIEEQDLRLVFEEECGRWEVLQEQVDFGKFKHAGRIVDLIQQQGPQRCTDVEAHLGINKGTVSRTLLALVAGGHLRIVPGKQYALPEHALQQVQQLQPDDPFTEVADELR